MVGRVRGALAARGTRRKDVHVDSVAASMPPHGPAIGEDTAPESESVALLKACVLLGLPCDTDRTRRYPNNARQALLAPRKPTLSTGPCPPTVAGPYAAWMPRKSLQGRTCSVSCEGWAGKDPAATRQTISSSLASLSYKQQALRTRACASRIARPPIRECTPFSGPIACRHDGASSARNQPRSPQLHAVSACRSTHASTAIAATPMPKVI